METIYMSLYMYFPRKGLAIYLLVQACISLVITLVITINTCSCIHYNSLTLMYLKLRFYTLHQRCMLQ